ncbi:hypothetical protein KO518_01880 [Aestuariibacter sp. A3R04]|nr:hypothetical protein [Aestuariibacter sp. A3R04]
MTYQNLVVAMSNDVELTMCLDTIKISRKPKKSRKTLSHSDETSLEVSKHYHYRVRGTRTSALVKKAILASAKV